MPSKNIGALQRLREEYGEEKNKDPEPIKQESYSQRKDPAVIEQESNYSNKTNDENVTLKSHLDIKTLSEATQAIKSIDKDIGKQWIQLSYLLKKVRDDKMYLPSYQTFQEYCEQEIDYSRQTAYAFIKIAEEFSEEQASGDSLLSLGVSKLIALTSIDNKTRKELLGEIDIENISVSELKKEIKKKKEKEKLLLENYNKSFTLTSEEHYELIKTNSEIENFNNIVRKITAEKTNEDSFSHQQICYLKDSIDKTKTDIRKLEKIFKKYL